MKVEAVVKRFGWRDGKCLAARVLLLLDPHLLSPESIKSLLANQVPVLPRMVLQSSHLEVSSLELNRDILASQRLVRASEGSNLVLHAGRVLGIDEDLDELGAIDGLVVALADNLRGVDEVLEDRGVDRGEGARTGARLLAAARAASGLGEDATLTDEEDLAV